MSIRLATLPRPPRRTARFEDEPGFYEPANLYFYGNIRLLQAPLAFVPDAFGSYGYGPSVMHDIEREAERHVLNSRILVCGIQNAAHMRTAIVPLRWGSPRIVVFSGGFYHHLGSDLQDEPFLSATLWRERWDPKTDLAVSRRAPNKLPTWGRIIPTVDALIRRIAFKEDLGLLASD